MFENLFKPITIRGTTFKNRVKMPGMAACMIDKGYVTDRFIAYHVARAKGGCGLNTLEATCVHAPTAPEALLKICDDSYMPGLTRLCDAVHAAGGKMSLQLDQGGISTFYVDSDLPVFIPSGKPEFGIEQASYEFMAEIRQAFADAAARAKKCGFDAVELHVGHGYALHAFLSPWMNKREDEYGGSPENRARYVLEVIRDVRAAVGEEMPIFMRIAPFDDLPYDGLTKEDVAQFCRWAKEAGVDALDVTRGNCWGYGSKYEIPPMDLPRGFNIENAAYLKQNTDLVVVGVGRINDPAQAEAYIADGLVDMVDIGRAQIADPEFCNKAQAGRVEDIVRCIGCLEGCFDRCMNEEYPHISCLMNPSVGKEEEYIFIPAAQSKKVLVVGGGVAGLEAAWVLKNRGHEVILAEKEAELGGNFKIAGVAPRKEEIIKAVESRAGQVERAGVEIRLNTTVTPELLAEIGADEVIVATGGKPIIIPIPGHDNANVYDYDQILREQVKPEGHVVVIGGGLFGAEAAEYLAAKGYEVSIVEMTGELVGNAGATRAEFINDCIEEAGIHVYTNAKAKEIREKALIVEKRTGELEVAGDCFVMAVGAKPAPDADLVQWCEVNNVPCHVIGDAAKIDLAIEAIAAAAELARKI